MCPPSAIEFNHGRHFNPCGHWWQWRSQWRRSLNCMIRNHSAFLYIGWRPGCRWYRGTGQGQEVGEQGRNKDHIGWRDSKDDAWRAGDKDERCVGRRGHVPIRSIVIGLPFSYSRSLARGPDPASNFKVWRVLEMMGREIFGPFPCRHLGEDP
jgi:hypothetical protein